MTTAAHLPGPLAGLAGPLAHYGYLVIALFLLLENIGVPVIPGEAMLIAGAIDAGAGGPHPLNVVAVGVVAVVACVAGADIGYGIGRFGGRALVVRYGKYVLIKAHHLEKAERTVDRYGAMVVVVARFIVGLRELNGVIAGITGMRWLTFVIFNAAGAVAWVAMWVTVGYLAGDHVNTIYNDIQRYSLLAAAVVALAVLALGARAIFRCRRRRAAS